MEYAIVDIETTGGHASGSGITEIAIRIHNGISVTDQYETLINPERPIPVYITALTGIDHEMVAESPAFHEVAEEVYRMLNGRVFVAHNVNFDYSFIKYYLEEAGYSFSAPKLCTVRMSRKIRPGLPSYSLGKLCHSLQIPLTGRHRAGGDADATAILFSQLIRWDTRGLIRTMLKKGSKEQQLPPHLPKSDFEALPHTTGVYYFKDKNEKVIYVGKAKDLRKRVLQHFTGNNPAPQRQHFLRNIHSISYEECGTELMALLLEAVEIKRLWPRYNRAMKRYEPRFGLFQYEDQNSFIRLAIGKFNRSLLPLQLFTHLNEGRNMLYKLTREYGLCPRLCHLGDCDTCSQDCLLKGAPNGYNQRVQQALARYKENLPSFIILDKGRNEEEQSCICVEQGCFYGMGYISHYSDPRSLAEVKSTLTRYIGNHYMMQIIEAYAKKHADKVIQVENKEAQAEDQYF